MLQVLDWHPDMQYDQKRAYKWLRVGPSNHSDLPAALVDVCDPRQWAGHRIQQVEIIHNAELYNVFKGWRLLQEHHLAELPIPVLP